MNIQELSALQISDFSSSWWMLNGIRGKLKLKVFSICWLFNSRELDKFFFLIEIFPRHHTNFHILLCSLGTRAEMSWAIFSLPKMKSLETFNEEKEESGKKKESKLNKLKKIWLDPSSLFSTELKKKILWIRRKSFFEPCGRCGTFLCANFYNNSCWMKIF